MRIVVMGTGGVGGYFGARLAEGGADVAFVARGAHLDAMRANGLQVESPSGNIHLPRPTVTDDPASLGGADIILFGVKLWDTEDAARRITPIVGPDTGVISFQNGVQKDDMLRAILGPKAVMGGVCYVASTIARPGVIAHTGALARLIFGEHDGTISPRTEALLDCCRRAGINAEISPDIRKAIWEKFVFLVGISSLTTATRDKLGPIRTNPQTRALLLDCMREVVSVGRALGVDLPADFAEDRLAFCDTLAPEMTSSMFHDLQRGNRLELPWLAGGIVTLGQQAGIATPVNRMIADLLALHAAGAGR
jgi:2-dehydropantoate 2-reductase